MCGRERLTRRRPPACPDPAPLRRLARLTLGGGGLRVLAGDFGLVDEHPDRVRGQVDAHGRSLLEGRVSAAILQPRLQGLAVRSEEHTSELQSHVNLVCRLLLEKKKN